MSSRLKETKVKILIIEHLNLVKVPKRIVTERPIPNPTKRNVEDSFTLHPHSEHDPS